jgi:hypothetical protein
MKRPLAALAAAALAALASALPIYAFPPQTSVAADAVAWLHTQQAADGTVAGNASRTEETVWGLIANKLTVADFSTSGKTPIDSLRTHLADEEKSAGNIGSLVMAVSAAGLDATSFGGRNLLQDLQCTYNPQTGGYNTQLFNDALAVLALPAGAAPAKAKALLASQQRADGGWEFQAGFGTDTNTTALVLMALVSSDGLDSTVKDRALAYFKLHQKPSGGFEYSDPFAPPGDSDPNSDALVIEALFATGENPTAAKWSMVDGDANAVTDLLTFRYPNGGFGFNRPDSTATAAPDAASTTQALPALAAAFLPVKRTAGVMPTSCPVTATTPAPTAAPVPAPSQLPPTGSSPIGALGGLVLIGLGWRLRRRVA